MPQVTQTLNFNVTMIFNCPGGALKYNTGFNGLKLTDDVDSLYGSDSLVWKIGAKSTLTSGDLSGPIVSNGNMIEVKKIELYVKKDC